MRWGEGLVQESQAKEMARKLQLEKDAKFATYADDSGLNATLKERDRWGDPMAALNKSSGGKTYKGAAPANRFNIVPGNRWDGVDRGNGFEAKYFQHVHASAVFKQEFHAWSTEDM
jgi:pre-mRNA-splicing factor CWC26